MKKNYENAIKLLETRRRKARPKSTPGADRFPPVSEMPSVNGAPTFRGTPSVVGMREWLQILGHSDSDVDSLNIIHVAGTKGKGSTCAFIRSFLKVHGLKSGFPQKIGLYTSPDLRCIRERIQINDQPILEELFTRYFFEVWDRLSSQESPDERRAENMPRFLQLLALIAFHTFIREKTQATIYETHHGGEYDATNVFRRPIATGITTIGLDHIAQLGPSIENIAWHKAGIFKPGAPAFSAPQDPEPAAVLRARAAEKGVELRFVEVDPSLRSDAQVLQPAVQRINCSLALALVGAFLEQKSSPEWCQLTSDDISRGIENFSWAGRFEVIVDGDSQWFLDGAHNELSVKQAAGWFAKSTSKERNDMYCPRILIFSHFSEERDGAALLESLAKSLAENGIRPEHVIFTTYQERQDGTTRVDKTFKIPEKPYPNLGATYSALWKRIDPEAQVASEQAIEGALNLARKIGNQGNGMQTLVTGSLQLVGGALNLLRPLR